MGYSLDQAIRELFHTENILSYTEAEGNVWRAATQGCVPSHAWAIRTNLGRTWDKANGWREQAEKGEDPISGDLQLSVKDITDLSFKSKVALSNVVQEVKKNREAEKEKAEKEAEFKKFFARAQDHMANYHVTIGSGSFPNSIDKPWARFEEALRKAWYGQLI